MNSHDFDWTLILPEDERKKVIADRTAFLASFPTKEEVIQAGNEGRAAFKKACAIVDFRKALHTLLAEATDDLGVDFVKAQLRDAEALVGLIPTVVGTGAQ